MALEGRRIGNYTIERLLGQGAMGSVYLARHDTLFRKVAIKFILPELATDQGLLDRFVDEAREVSRLGHPALVQVLDFGATPDGLRYSVMEYLEGASLAQALAASGPMPPARVARIGADIADGLAVVHDAGIVHRDLKPDNLYLASGGSRGEQVKILDFGIAKLLGADGQGARRTKAGAVLGTPTYISPEQARSSADVDARCDQYSLGVVLYELLAGTPPFDGNLFELLNQHANAAPPPLATRAPRVPAALADVVMRCLEKDPARRFPGMRELRGALLAAGGAAPSKRWGMGKLAAVMLAVAALASVVVAIAMKAGSPPPKAAVATVPDAAPALPARNPYRAADATAVASGAAIYLSKCARCHGAKGEGNGNDIPAGLEPKSFADARTLPGALDTYRFEIIRRGIEEGGKDTMPSFEGKLSADDTWKVVTFLGTFAPPAPPEDLQGPKSKPEFTRELVARGAKLFRMKCASCHGKLGKGDGPARELLDRIPADLTSGVFKRRSTPKGAAPLDEDIFRTITMGMGDGGMPSFAKVPEEDRWAAVAYVKTLAPPVRPVTLEDALVIPRRPPVDDAAVQRGHVAFLAAGCPKCHGPEGHGNGPRAGDLLDYRANPVRPTDYRSPALFVGGSGPVDIYRTMMTGISGTPMPQAEDFFDPEQAWDVVAFIESVRKRPAE